MVGALAFSLSCAKRSDQDGIAVGIPPAVFALLVQVFTAWQTSPDVFEEHVPAVSCSIPPGGALDTVCTFDIPEAQLFYGHLKIRTEVDSSICKLVRFFPYFYQASRLTNFTPEWGGGSSFNCSGATQPMPTECFNGMAPEIVPNFPDFDHIFYIPAENEVQEFLLDQSANETFRRSNRFTANTLLPVPFLPFLISIPPLFTPPALTPRTLDLVLPGDSAPGESGDGFIALSMRDYIVECVDGANEPIHRVALIINDSDIVGNTLLADLGIVDDPTNHRKDWNSTMDPVDFIPTESTMFLEVATAWGDEPNIFETHGSCSIPIATPPNPDPTTNIPPSDIECTVTIPEGQLFFSHLRLSLNTAPEICEILFVIPYHYLASASTEFLPEWADSQINCSGSDPSQLPADCFSGVGAFFQGPNGGTLNFPAKRGFVFPNNGDGFNGHFTIPISAFEADRRTNRFTVNDLLIPGRLLSLALAGDIFIGEGGDGYIGLDYPVFATRMRDYVFDCRDKWEQPQYSIRLTIKDEDIDEDPPDPSPLDDDFNHRADWNTIVFDPFFLSVPFEICGNGSVHEFFEECDDGNTDDFDGCTTSCLIGPVCGDGAAETPEVCDDGNRVNETPDDELHCNADCTAEIDPLP